MTLRIASKFSRDLALGGCWNVFKFYNKCGLICFLSGFPELGEIASGDDLWTSFTLGLRLTIAGDLLRTHVEDEYVVLNERMQF